MRSVGQLCKFYAEKASEKKTRNEIHTTVKIFMVMIWCAFELTTRQLNSTTFRTFQDRWIFQCGLRTTNSHTQIHFVNFFSPLCFRIDSNRVDKKGTLEFFMTNDKRREYIWMTEKKPEKIFEITIKKWNFRKIKDETQASESLHNTFAYEFDHRAFFNGRFVAALIEDERTKMEKCYSCAIWPTRRSKWRACAWSVCIS